MTDERPAVTIDADMFDELIGTAAICAHLLRKGYDDAHDISVLLLGLIKEAAPDGRACPSCGTEEPEHSSWHQVHCHVLSEPDGN